MEVNLSHILHNVREIRSLLDAKTKLMAVVKADAYGHGAIPVAKALEGEVDSFGVAIIDEAIDLREEGIETPIQILGLTPKEEQEYLFEYNLIPTISRLDQVASLSREASREGEEIGFHLKVDTGMGRIGLRPESEDLLSFLHAYSKYLGVSLQGVMSHFSSADEDPLYTREQYERFLESTDSLSICKHIANSAGLLRDKRYHLHMVRPGLILYGLWPSEELKREAGIELRRALTWKTKIVHLKTLPYGNPISYSRNYKTFKEETVVATLPLGYEDGFLRANGNMAQVLVRGERAPVIGNICMDQFMVDVTDIEDVSIGDEVILLGDQGEDAILAEEHAICLRSINYEVVTNIGKRVPRDYLYDSI